MPKFSAAAHHDGNKIKKSKHRGHQYRDATKVRKHRQTRIKGVVEEVVEPVESGTKRPLKRSPKYNLAKLERMLRANGEKTRPNVTPILPAEVYCPNPVNFNVPRVTIPISEATAKWVILVLYQKRLLLTFRNRRKQATTGNDDGDVTDVDDEEDVIVVPAGFVEAAENLGLLSTSATSSGPPAGLEEPSPAPHVQPDEKPPAELPATIKTPSPSIPVPQTGSSAPSPPSSTQPLPVEVIDNHDNIQDKPSPPISESVPQATSVPELSQEAGWSFPPQYQNTAFCDDVNDPQPFQLHHQGIQNPFYPDSTNEDINMDLSSTDMLESPVYSLPTIRISPQPEHHVFYRHFSQVANNNLNDQTYTMNPNRASMVSVPGSIVLLVDRIEARSSFNSISNQRKMTPFNGWPKETHHLIKWSIDSH